MRNTGGTYKCQTCGQDVQATHQPTHVTQECGQPASGTALVTAARALVHVLRLVALVCQVVAYPYAMAAKGAAWLAAGINRWADQHTMPARAAIAPSKIIVLGPCQCGCNDPSYLSNA